MKIINLLIKPASSSCNLNCTYCFYNDVADNRSVKNYGIMTDETLENMVKKAFEEVTYQVNFAFQGGEPTVAGLEYFKKFHKLVEKYNKENVGVTFALQTNGTLLDKNWTVLFRKYNYLLGISLDGNKEIHNSFRVDKQGKETFSKVYKTLRLLKKEKVEFNILAVVNKMTAENGKLVYNFFKNSGFRYFQFIPCLDKLYSEQQKEYTLTDIDYGNFLNDTFELWYQDIMSGKKTSVRYFDNMIKIILGEKPEACDMVGHCNVNGIIEADGSVYPCDFYVLDEYKLGNINESSYMEMFRSDRAEQFVKSSLKISNRCKVCKYFKLCRSGCKRHKELDENGEYQNRFCKSYLMFFDKNIDKLIEIANYIIKIRAQNIG